MKHRDPPLFHDVDETRKIYWTLSNGGPLLEELRKKRMGAKRTKEQRVVGSSAGGRKRSADVRPGAKRRTPHARPWDSDTRRTRPHARPWDSDTRRTPHARPWDLDRDTRRGPAGFSFARWKINGSLSSRRKV